MREADSDFITEFLQVCEREFFFVLRNLILLIFVFLVERIGSFNSSMFESF